MNYTIKNKQNAIDVVNNTYTNHDHFSDLYILNDTFDINEMQTNLTLNYNKPISQIYNDIQNNGYTFINDDVVTFEQFLNVNIIDGNYTILPIIECKDNNPNILIKNNDLNISDIYEYGDTTTNNLYKKLWQKAKS